MFLSSSATSKKEEEGLPRAINSLKISQATKSLKKVRHFVKDHERVGQSFQNQQPQNQELAAELEEQEKDAEELANLVQTKSEAIKTLKTKFVDAKRTIAELKAELKTLWRTSAATSTERRHSRQHPQSGHNPNKIPEGATNP